MTPKPRFSWLSSVKEYLVDMLLFIAIVLILIYFASLGTGYSPLLTEIMIPTFILIILYYMFEGAPEGPDQKNSNLRRKLRKWGRRAVLACVIGIFGLVAGPNPNMVISSFSVGPSQLGLILAGISFMSFCVYWIYISKQAESIPTPPSEPTSSTSASPAHSPQ